jgi:hypothetical protein
MAIARYSVRYGLSGCYMPDSNNGPYIFTRRKDLADCIRDQLDMFDMPASLIREVKLIRLWRHIKRYGSSTAHFHLSHGANTLTFSGLTEEEADQMEKENE